MNRRISNTPSGGEFSVESLAQLADARIDAFRDAVSSVVPTRVGRPVSAEIADDVQISAQCASKRFNDILKDPDRRDSFVCALAGPEASNETWAIADAIVPPGPLGGVAGQGLDQDQLLLPSYCATRTGDIWQDGLKGTTRLPEGIAGAVVQQEGAAPTVLVSADLGFRESQVTVSQGLAAALALQANAAGVPVRDRAHFDAIAGLLIDDHPPATRAGGNEPWPDRAEVLVQSTVESAVVLYGLGASSKADPG